VEKYRWIYGTSFNFGIKNAAIDVAYVDAAAVSTRNAATDEVDLALTQNLGKVQLRCGLTQGGEMKFTKSGSILIISIM